MDQDLKEAVGKWLEWDPNPKTRKEVSLLSPSEVQKVMVPRIAFGTAGLRAEMGPGFAKMNDVTVLQAAQGLAQYILKADPVARERGIVIGHDHRFLSQRFAQLTATAFLHKKIKVIYLGLVITPLIPFTVKLESASCGVAVTASHNPAKDNGYKVYWSNGCQIIPPHDSGIASEIERNLVPWTWDTSIADATIQDVYRADAKYFQQSIWKRHSALRSRPLCVYTPMHGLGLPYALKASSLLGIVLKVVPAQANPDPEFRTVRFPNPEEDGALDLAYQVADETNADVVLANDPDADRFCCAIKEHNRWRKLTGDEVGLLLADFLIQESNSSNKAVLNSTVSSQSLKYLAQKLGANYVEALTGFKWLGNRTLQLQEKGCNVVFAYEEALGYMCNPEIPDKDGITALYEFLRVLLRIENRGSTISRDLEHLYSRIGHFATHNSYYVATPQEVRETFVQIRKSGVPKTIGTDFQVLAWRDLTTGYDSTTPDNRVTLPMTPSSDMITVEGLLGTSTIRFTTRGSGTEPKLKVYIEARSTSQKGAQYAADTVWDLLGQAWFRTFASS